MAKAIKTTIEIQNLVETLKAHEQKLAHTLPSLPLQAATESVQSFSTQYIEMVQKVAGSLEDFVFAELYHKKGTSEIERNVNLMLKAACSLQNPKLYSVADRFRQSVQNAQDKFEYATNSSLS